MSYSITYKVAVYSSAHSKAIYAVSNSTTSDSSTSKAIYAVSHDPTAKNRTILLIK